MIRRSFAVAAACALAAAGCQGAGKTPSPRASGFVEATEVRVASRVPGRVAAVHVVEGARVAEGDPVVTLSTAEIDLAIARARADRDQAGAQLRLLQAGSRSEDVAQAAAQVEAASADARAADADLNTAKSDEARFEQLLRTRAGSQKQRDDAVARREEAEARVKAANDRVSAASATLARLKAGARPEEIESARAHVAAAQAQIASLEHDRSDTAITSPLSGVVTSRLVEPGELVAAGTPVAVIVDLDHAWVNAYVEEPFVPSLKLDEPVSVTTDSGAHLDGRVSFISPEAEFTPRNVQTSAERAKLVYRVKVSVDNRQAILKPGMPVDVTWSGAPAPAGR